MLGDQLLRAKHHRAFDRGAASDGPGQPRGFAQVGQVAGRRCHVESLGADVEQDADRPPVERQRDRGADGAAMPVRFREHVDRLALRSNCGLALRLTLRARHRADGGGYFGQKGTFLDKGVGGLVHPIARCGIDRFTRSIVDDPGMATVEQAQKMDGIGQVAHRVGAARQRAGADVRMRAGAVAGDQRIEHFGDAARLYLGLGRLAQRVFLACGAGREGQAGGISTLSHRATS